MSSAIQSAQAINELATLLIPVNDKQLLLPNVTVAEIIPYVEPVAGEEDVPNWFLGHIQWRGQEIPVVSFEAINEEPFASSSSNRRIAVLNGIVDDQRMPFCGLLTEGAPRLMRILPDDLVNDETRTLGPAELSRVLAGGEAAAIPNVDFIQQQLLDLL